MSGILSIETWVGEEDAIAVLLAYVPGTPGRCSGPAEFCYPEESPEIEWELQHMDGSPWTDEISSKDEERIEAALLAKLEEQAY